jgi:phospholipid/cholesterol/gamma-HCH transport system ATP-binding protein
MNDGPIIRWEGIHKAFDGKPVLRGVTLDVHCGETLVIIGKSGCGKTVLMKTLVGLETPDSGSIRVNGRNIIGERDAMRYARALCAMVFQSAALFDSMTVAENLALFAIENTHEPIPAILDHIEDLLNRVGMAGAGNLKPAALSGGMRKRVSLARALAQKPEIILYDEPTTGLDPITADSINELILQMHRDSEVTSVVVTHDLVSARKVGDRVAMLHEGEIVFEGTMDALFESDNPIVSRFVRGEAEEESLPAHDPAEQ